MGSQFRPAARTAANPLIGLFSLSGCGKTYSSLLLARGLVGPNGKIAMIDTESGRGQLYSDVIPGGYDVLDLEPPFTAARYIEAFNVAVSAGYDVCIIDSASHEWEGIGGVLDQAAANEARTKKSGLHNWSKPKAEHNKFLQALLRAPIPVIVNLRAKYKTRQVKGSGKTEIVRDDFPTAIQSEEFIYEMTTHAEILSDHTLRVTKPGHPGLREAFPNGKMLSIEHGQKFAEWIAAGAGAEDTDDIIAAMTDQIQGLRSEEALESWWGSHAPALTSPVVKEVHHGTPGKAALILRKK